MDISVIVTEMTANTDFDVLLKHCYDLARMFEEGLVYIGGIAVYLHAKNAADPRTQELAETTHDADFYISLADMGDLRDIEEVVANRRLSKSQLIKGGFEFDIYTERQSGLIVPYADVIAHSVVRADIRVACLEHLFVLKLEAWLDRRASAKGAKDARDLVRIACVAAGAESQFDSRLVAPYLSQQHVAMLQALRKTSEIVALAKGNAVTAKKMRAQVEALVSSVTAPQNADVDAGDTDATRKRSK
ncbi:MAG: hypothetical protein NVS2B4_00060 [Ramlibacter sp.]